jgi:apolipoprotein N-acyltransferase
MAADTPGADAKPRRVDLLRPGLGMVLGAVSAAALPPWGVWWILPISFSAFAVLLDSLGDRRPAAAGFRAGLAFGFGYFAVSLAWIGQAFFVDAETYAWMMPFAVAGLPAILAVYWGLAAAAAALAPPGGARTLAFAVALALAELARALLFTGFPWNAPGYAVSGLVGVLQTASVVGLYGLTLLVLLWSVTPALAIDAFRRRSWWRAILPVLLMASAFATEAAGRVRLAAADDAAVAGVRLRIVQPAVPQTLKWDEAEARRIWTLLLSMTRGEAKGAGPEPPTLVIWPESAPPFLLAGSPDGLAQAAAALPPGAHLLAGALYRPAGAPAGSSVFNSILGIAPGGKVIARYDKWRLVPFGEYLPLAAMLEPLGLRRIVTVPGGLMPGDGPKIVRLEGFPAFVPLVCYEAVFPGASQPEGERAAFLLNVTNDAWFGDSAGPHQHFEQARMRAVEQGLPLIRAANTGISAVVDGHGRVRAEAALGTRAVVDALLPVALSSTTYARFGIAGFIAMCGLSIAVLNIYSRRWI